MSHNVFASQHNGATGGDAVTIGVLTSSDRARLTAAARPRRYRRREVVVSAGDVGNALFWIESGHVAVRIDTEAGDSVTLTILGPGDSFGELALLEGSGRRSATVVALDDLLVYTLGRGQLDRLRATSTAMDHLIIKLLLAQVRRLTGQLVEALHVPVPQRVARHLLRLGELYAPGSDSAVLDVTQDELAGLVGATRPTVNQVLQSLAERGAVGLSRGKIEIRSRRLLLRISR